MDVPENTNQEHEVPQKTTITIDQFFTEMKMASRFQVIFQLAAMYVSLTICYFFMLSVFSTSDSAWKCTRNDNSTGNDSFTARSSFCRQHSNKTFVTDDQDFEKRCSIKREVWAYVQPKEYSALTEFDLVCDRTYISALVGSSYYIGGILGSTLSGVVADSFGRKPVVLASLIVVSVSSVGGAFVSNVWQLISLNTILGASCAGCYFTLYVYHQEVVSTRFRTVSSSLVLCFFSMSYLLIDLIAYYVRHWRKLRLYLITPTILSIAVFSFLPESPRWLLSIGKVSRANKILQWIRCFNGEQADTNTELIPSSRSCDTKYTYLDLLRRFRVLVQVLSIGMIWFSISLLMYAYMLGAPTLGGNIYISFFFSMVGDFPSYILAPYLSNRFGRKMITIGGLALSGVFAGCVSLVPSSLYYVKMVLMIIAKVIGCTVQNIAYTFSFEIFPTPVRSQGISVCIIFGRVGICIVPFLTQVLQKYSHVLPFFIAGGVAVVVALFGLVLPETNGQPTRESYEDFYKKRPVVNDADNCVHLDDEAL